MSSTVATTTSTTAHEPSLPVGSDGAGGLARVTWTDSKSIVLEGDPAARRNVLRAVAAHARVHGDVVIDLPELDSPSAQRRLQDAEHALMDRLDAARDWQVSPGEWRQVVILADAAGGPGAERLVRCVLGCGTFIHAAVVFGVDQCDGPKWSRAAGARVVQVVAVKPGVPPTPRDTFAVECVVVAA